MDIRFLLPFTPSQSTLWQLVLQTNRNKVNEFLFFLFFFSCLISFYFFQEVFSFFFAFFSLFGAAGYPIQVCPDCSSYVANLVQHKNGGCIASCVVSLLFCILMLLTRSNSVGGFRVKFHCV